MLADRLIIIPITCKMTANGSMQFHLRPTATPAFRSPGRRAWDLERSPIGLAPAPQARRLAREWAISLLTKAHRGRFTPAPLRILGRCITLPTAIPIRWWVER